MEGSNGGGGGRDGGGRDGWPVDGEGGVCGGNGGAVMAMVVACGDGCEAVGRWVGGQVSAR